MDSVPRVLRVEEGVVRALPIREPIPVALALLVALVAVVQGASALRGPSIWVVPDELIYRELSKNLGAGGFPRIRDEPS